MRLAAARNVVLTATVAGLAATAPAQTLPPPAVVPAPAPWTRFTLPNGMVVLVAERPGVPIVIVRRRSAVRLQERRRIRSLLT